MALGTTLVAVRAPPCLAVQLPSPLSRGHGVGPANHHRASFTGRSGTIIVMVSGHLSSNLHLSSPLARRTLLLGAEARSPGRSRGLRPSCPPLSRVSLATRSPVAASAWAVPSSDCPQQLGRRESCLAPPARPRPVHRSRRPGPSTSGRALRRTRQQRGHARSRLSSHASISSERQPTARSVIRRGRGNVSLAISL